MSMTFTRPELELKRRAPLPGGQPGTHEFVRAATVIVGFSDTCDFVCSGAADEVEINAAITYVNSLGWGIVHIEEGTYILAGSILPLSNVTIMGEWPLLDGGVVDDAIDINGVTNIHLHYLRVQTTAGGGFANDGIRIRGGSSHIIIHMIHIMQSDQDGISITSADSHVIINMVSLDTIDRHGVNCDGDNCELCNNDLDNIGDDGIFFDVNSDGCIAHNNHVHLWVNEPVDDDGDNTVYNNPCTAAGVPVVAWNSKGCGFATIQATIDHQVTGGGVEILAGTHTVAAGVITLTAVSNIHIHGQGRLITTLSSSVGACITLVGACLNITISDLSFLTTGVGANNGIDITGASLAVFLESLACTDCGQDAISIVAAASEVMVRSCYLYNNITRHGINLAGDNCQIRGNRIFNVGDDGVWIQAGAAKNIVALNRISGSGSEDIDWDDPDNTVVHNETGA